MKKKNNLTLVMTACIKPNKNVFKLFLKDDKIRLSHYISALSFYVHCGKFDKIIFCDNSDYLLKISEITPVDGLSSTSLELLSFEGNSEKTHIKGKGYGDGEIFDYALKNTKFDLSNDIICKVSGRYKILNLKRILSNIGSYNYFSLHNYREKNSHFDGVFWIMHYRDALKLGDFYDLIEDTRGYYYEHALRNRVESAKIEYKYVYPRPKYDVPLTGSEGHILKYSLFRGLIRNMTILYKNILKRKF